MYFYTRYVRFGEEMNGSFTRLFPLRLLPEQSRFRFFLPIRLFDALDHSSLSETRIEA